MNKLIDKYIYAVTKRCNKTDRIEIKKELEANIYDMLGNNLNPTDLEIEQVLYKLGNPVLIAAKYQKEDRYLVKPAFYNDFVTILKIVVPGFAIIGLLLTVVEILTTELSTDLVRTIIYILSNSLQNMISSAIGGFAIVVLVFWSYNINSVKKAVDKWLDNWKVKDLLEVPKQIDNNKKTVTRMSIVFQLLFTIIFGLAFIIVFNKYGAFGFYQGDLLLEPIFNDGPRSLTLILIISIFILSIIYYIIYLIKGSKTTALLVFDTFNALLALGTLTYFLTFPNLINNEFIVVIANNFNMTNERISGIINSNLNITLITTVSVVLIVYIISWVRHLKNRI